MINLDKLACLLTGRRFQYQGELRYYPDPNDGQTFSSLWISFSVDYRDEKVMSRGIRKIMGKEFMRSVPKRMRRNGRISLINISYLGFY